MALAIAATARFSDIAYWYWYDSEEAALALTGTLAAFSILRVEIYSIEWLMRYFGYAGLVANWCAYYPLKYYYVNVFILSSLALSYISLY